MALFGDLKDDHFANKIANHYYKHIGKNEFKDIRSEAAQNNPQTPLWNTQPFMQRGIQRGKDNPSGKLNFITAPILDTARVAKFMTSPLGLLFIAKNVGLQLSNPKMEYGIAIHPNRIYNPISTIAQIPANIIGLHMDRHFKSVLNTSATNYENILEMNNKVDRNRLLLLAQDLKVGRFNESAKPVKIPKILTKMTDIVAKFGKFFGREAIPIKRLSGLMGPNSLFGLGMTTIYRSKVPLSFTDDKHKAITKYSHGDDTYLNINPEGIFKELHEYNRTEGAYGIINEPVPASGESTTPRGIFAYKSFEYGDIIRASKESTLIDYTGKKDYTEANANSVYGLVDYGSQRGVSDKLVTEEDSELDDFVKFSITGKIGGSDRVLKFRAFGLGSISDDTSFGWNEVNYSGRTAPQYAFDKVSRTLTHDLMIPAFTSKELKANYNKLDQLYKMASPTIDSSGLPTAPLNKFTLGDLYDDVNVLIEKITFTIEEDFSWDIGVGDGDETSGAQLPMIIKLNLSYKFATNVDGNLFTNASRFFGKKIEEFKNV
tara:strand:+ start:1755 stop:3389 length:1635 start_codon:yes stop_codon:yes gene_type:complete